MEVGYSLLHYVFETLFSKDVTKVRNGLEYGLTNGLEVTMPDAIFGIKTRCIATNATFTPVDVVPLNNSIFYRRLWSLGYVGTLGRNEWQFKVLFFTGVTTCKVPALPILLMVIKYQDGL